MVKVCECGHESCFHKAKESGAVAFFVGTPQGRSCMAKNDAGKECMCLRFTAKEE